jgi:DNA polymerase III gamma/tau subunit
MPPATKTEKTKKLKPVEGRDLDQKYRPQRLEDLYGQDAAVATIRSWGENVPRCVMFHSVTPGVGKTSAARILCEDMGIQAPRDLVEVNCGAEASPIDFVRDLERKMRCRPLGSSGKCAWIFDEVQTWSKAPGAMQALLPILESCPDWVYYLLCTTDPGKLLPAVRSRCVDVEFKSVPDPKIEELVRAVADAEAITFGDSDVLDCIVACADGSPRNAIKALEKVAGINDADLAIKALGGGFGEGSEAFALVRAVLPFSGVPSWAEVAKVLTALEAQDAEGLRRMLMTSARRSLLKGGKNSGWAADVILGLEKSLFDRGTSKALLAGYLYELFRAKKLV